MNRSGSEYLTRFFCIPGILSADRTGQKIFPEPAGLSERNQHFGLLPQSVSGDCNVACNSGGPDRSGGGQDSSAGAPRFVGACFPGQRIGLSRFESVWKDKADMHKGFIRERIGNAYGHLDRGLSDCFRAVGRHGSSEAVGTEPDLIKRQQLLMQFRDCGSN